MLIKADFHIHSCLSPCGSLEMSPQDIVQRAKSAGLNLIAISDHNSALNSTALYDLTHDDEEFFCFYGMEVTTLEEVHVVSLFNSPDEAMDFSRYIYDNLVPIKNDPDKFGDQVYVDKDNMVLGEVDNFLGSATNFSVDDLVKEVHSRQGLFIPAHVDRPAFSMTSQLGFLPVGDYDAVEFSKHYLKNTSRDKFYDGPVKQAKNYPVIVGSDAHYLDDIGSVWNEFEVDEVSLKSVKKILDSTNFDVIINF